MVLHNILPLVSWRSPADVWAHEPTFLVAEIVCSALTLLMLRHALRTAEHAFVAVACFFGGALIELFTILETEIGNFYHSQATVTLFGHREPLYMLLSYILIQYASVILPRGMGLSVLGESCIAGLLSTFLFGVLDAVGLKFLWWTWHAADPLYADRNLGVPIASSFWIMVSTASLTAVLRRYGGAVRLPRALYVLSGAVMGPFATLGVMNIPFLVIYHPLVTWGGYHAGWALSIVRGISLVMVLREFARAPRITMAVEYVSVALLTLTFVLSMVTITLFGDPSTIVRTSYSQPFGPCDTTESCFWGGFTRRKFVCPDTIDPERDHYSLACVSDVPTLGADWYTVCGVPAAATWWPGVTYLFAGAIGLVLLSLLHIHAAPSAAKTK
eukprot:m.258151 g.258151  ORF g.258151 m.258151 type:complete len:386 (-) comp21333_c0_seq1:48-1205(-)